MLTSLLFSSLKATSVIWMCTKTTSFEIVTLNKYFSSGQFGCSVVSNSLQPHRLQHARLPVHHQLPELAQTHVHCISDVIQPSHPLSSPSLPTFNLSSISVFSNESALHIRWLTYWSFSFSISPSSKYSGLISFRIDWFDLLAVKGLSRVFSSTTIL